MNIFAQFMVFKVRGRTIIDMEGVASNVAEREQKKLLPILQSYLSKLVIKSTITGRIIPILSISITTAKWRLSAGSMASLSKWLVIT